MEKQIKKEKIKSDKEIVSLVSTFHGLISKDYKPLKKNNSLNKDSMSKYLKQIKQAAYLFDKTRGQK